MDERTATTERPRFEMICLEDDDEGEHVCYLSLGHVGEHVWTPFRIASTPTDGNP